MDAPGLAERPQGYRRPAEGSHRGGDDALGAWDDRNPAGTTGKGVGTNGGRRIFWTCCGLALLITGICTVNIFTILDDAAKIGRPVTLWKVWTEEYSSLAGMVAALPLAVLIERSASARSWPKRAAILIAGSLFFSALHVALMVAIRHLVWWLNGDAYSFSASAEFFYEYRKDAMAYVIAMTAITVAARRPAIAPAEAAAPVARPTLVFLPDGSKEVAVNVATLVGVEGGGNYVELIGADGQRRLIRSTMGAAEAALHAHGFRRTHKSWLVKMSAVETAERTSAGDYRLTLAGGLVAPLSRRMTDVLKELKPPIRR